MADEPIGGDSYWFGSAEYSIPILKKKAAVGLRFALFYDVGAVGAAPYSFPAISMTTGAWASG
jgi:outer membrane protein assembly factor BamA